jgi:hypothetical protein
MSSLKAWEVVRTCVLARRWRHLWASAPCVDLRVRCFGREGNPPDEFRGFVHRLFLLRDVFASVDTLHTCGPATRTRASTRTTPTRGSGSPQRAGYARHRDGVALLDLDRVPFIY